MDVDATRTCDEFMRRMRRRWFGCGSAVHSKKEGGHDRDLCTYCKQVGHKEVVYMDKFMGKPKGQKVAATDEGSKTDLDSLGEDSEENKAKETAAATATTTTLAQLVQQQKTLADQLAALREMDF